MPISKERVDELRAKYGRVEHVRSNNLMPDPADPSNLVPCWEVVIRKPNRQEFKAFMSAGQSRGFDAQEMYAKQQMVEPADAAVIDALFDEWPGIPLACDEAIQRLAGLKAEDLSK